MHLDLSPTEDKIHVLEFLAQFRCNCNCLEVRQKFMHSYERSFWALKNMYSFHTGSLLK